MSDFIERQPEKNNKRKTATLRDVAKLAGVGTGSVSRYLNNDPSIKEVNRKKIAQAIRDLKFVPNNTARKLARGSSRNILLLLVSETPIMMASWMYEKVIVQEIYEALENSDYTLQLAIVSKKDSDEEYDTIKTNIRTKSVDAVMVLSNWKISDRNISFLTRHEIPYILIGCKNYMQSTNEILIDNYNSFKKMLDYLASLGHKDIALLTGNRDHEHMVERLRSYYETMKKHRFGVGDDYVQFGEYSMESGYQNTIKLIRNCRDHFPTAIVCGNDEIACGAIKALKDHHFKIPEEVSITGFDNSLSAQIVEPALTTIQSPGGMGKMATKKLLNMLEKETTQSESVVFNCELVVRNSAGQARDTR